MPAPAASTPPMAVSVSGIGSGSMEINKGDSVEEGLRGFFTTPFYPASAPAGCKYLSHKNHDKYFSNTSFHNQFR
jgi:hypothetical protein